MRWILLLAALLASPVFSQEPPEWFTESFLDLREDITEAAKDGKRVMLYFSQDGCPYCKQLVTVNFRDPKIVAKARRNFVSIAINIWGAREVTWIDGRRMPEKQFAQMLKIQFTPTLLFFDEKGGVAHRINGYLPPEEFYAALDGGLGKAVSGTAAPARKLLDLRRKPGGKPLAVVLLSPGCEACDELERHLKVAQVRSQLSRFELVRASNPTDVTTAAGRQTLSSGYLPALVFFDSGGREVFRTEAYLRPFHLAGALEYVASGAYAREPSFQRFLQAKSERMRQRGERVDLWN
jgi:thioredoxin-related protein